METLEQNIQPQVKIPNSTGVLALGILSIPVCCFYGGPLIGIVLAIIALVLYSKAQALYSQNPSAYTVGSQGNLKAGRICAIIGLILNGIVVLLFVWLISTFGWDVLNDPSIIEDWAKSLEKK